MRIIIIHNRYYQASGPERYLFNVKNLLESKGHTVIPFSINYCQNEASEYEEFFVNPVVEGGGFHISENENNTIKAKVKIIKNIFYNKEASEKLSKLVKQENPDIIYILQFYGKLSTSILDVSKKYKIPTVLRLSDYNLLCQKNILYRKGDVCEKCLKNSFNGVLNKCAQNSFSKSLILYLSYQYNYLKKSQLKLDAIITPSSFMKNIFLLHKKYKTNNIVHLPTFIRNNEIKPLYKSEKKEIKFCYFGRVADDKGIDVLLNAFRLLSKENIKPMLTIYGDYQSEYGLKLLDYVDEKKLSNITFYGYLDKAKLFEEIKDYSFSILPSLWYDNMPNSLIESQAMGIPVIASNIGSFKELVSDDYNGYLFESKSAQKLAALIKNTLYFNDIKMSELKKNSISWVKDYCSEEKHYLKLMEIFNNCINK